jgi:Cu-processing system ATP-binding protein
MNAQNAMSSSEASGGVRLEIQSLQKRYARTQALKGVSLQMRPGRVTGILGPNGCGKTTLIKSVLGLVVPDRGNILMNGVDILGSCEYRRAIGYMPQNPDFPGNLKISEILNLLENVRAQKAARREELCALFDLGPHLHKPFAALSGGTKQKVAAVAAFMFDPDVLILDEPTVGLDPVSMVKLKALVTESARQGRTVVLVTHMVAEIEQLVDEMVFLLDGEVQFCGSLDELRARTGAHDLDEAIVSLMERDAKPDKRTANPSGSAVSHRSVSLTVGAAVKGGRT